MNKEEKVKTVNPATEEVLNEYRITTKRQQINYKARKARNALMNGKKTQARESISFMILPINWGKIKRLARTATNEMGKVIKESRSEVENVFG